MRPESYWEASGTAPPPAPPLDGDVRADVAVVGAGYCGLNAALELAERGASVVVLDALALGKGASGRSGGFVAGRFRMPPATVLKRHGPDMVAMMQRISAASVEQVERNVVDLAIPEARFERHGSIRAAINERHLAALAAGFRGRVGADFGSAADLRFLSRAEIAAETGSERFVGGTLDPSVPALHPFNYTMGLARAVVARGVPIHAETLVTRASPDGAGIRLETPSGSVAAGQMIVATNAYSRMTGATEALAAGVIPFRSAVICTAEIPDDILRTILPNGRMMIDTKRILRWFRLVDGRLIVGGRGAGSPSQDAQAYRQMRRNLLEVYPQLSFVPIDYEWSGYVGLTLDALPHVGRASDQVVFAGGCNGNGVAVASLFGRYAARIALGDPPDVGILGSAWFRKVPFRQFSMPAARLGARWYHLLDELGL
jgi:glycine/D-amino acid oxidase-like deaminating enzyme